MNKADQDVPLRETRFSNQQLEALGIEVMSLDRLRQKMPPELLGQPERVDFFVLINVTSGRGKHWVDFTEHPLRAGTFVLVRPGQVQRWRLEGGYSATLVLIEPTALPYWREFSSMNEGDLLTLIEWPTASQLPSGLRSDICAALERIETDIGKFDGSDLDRYLIRHEFLVLMLRLARWQKSLARDRGVKARQLATYRLFIQELEKRFQEAHDLTHYANRLGYSQSTISRACKAAEGRSAKAVIDRRITLEAKRILIHTSSSIAQIGYDLGFSETTNFIKFFRRNAGVTPYQFRNRR